MVYTEESDLQVLKNNKSSKCKDAADELKRCLKETQCYKAGGKSMADCLLETSECQVSLLYLSYHLCAHMYMFTWSCFIWSLSSLYQMLYV